MRFMNEQNVARLEAQIERLVEGVCQPLWQNHSRPGYRVSWRGHGDGVRSAHGSDPRPLAPDEYTICRSGGAGQADSAPTQATQILGQRGSTRDEFGLPPDQRPIVRFQSDGLGAELVVKASHTTVGKQHRRDEASDLPPNVETPRNPRSSSTASGSSGSVNRSSILVEVTTR
jgi:hypothetical protein